MLDGKIMIIHSVVGLIKKVLLFQKIIAIFHLKVKVKQNESWLRFA